jgi:hypothetical protein
VLGQQPERIEPGRLSKRRQGVDNFQFIHISKIMDLTSPRNSMPCENREIASASAFP